MLELTVTIAAILLLHYLITNYRKKRAYRQRLLATNQIEPKRRVKLAPVFRRIISRGRL